MVFNATLISVRWLHKISGRDSSGLVSESSLFGLCPGCWFPATPCCAALFENSCISTIHHEGFVIQIEQAVDSILKQIGFREQHGVLLVGRQYGQRYPPRGLTISPVRRLQHAGMAKKSGRRTHCSPGL